MAGRLVSFAVDLLEKLPKLAKVERARLVLVELSEKLVESPQVPYCLGKLLLHLGRHRAPVAEVDLDRLRVLTVLPGQVTDEANDMVRHVVLHRAAVTNGVDVSQRGAVQTKVGVGLEGVAVRLRWSQLGSEALAEFGL